MDGLKENTIEQTGVDGQNDHTVYTSPIQNDSDEIKLSIPEMDLASDEVRKPDVGLDEFLKPSAYHQSDSLKEEILNDSQSDAGVTLLQLAIPLLAFKQCGTLRKGQVLDLKGASAGIGTSSSLHMSAEKRNKTVLLVLKSVNSALDQLSGSWNFVLKSIDVPDKQTSQSPHSLRSALPRERRNRSATFNGCKNKPEITVELAPVKSEAVDDVGIRISEGIPADHDDPAKVDQDISHVNVSAYSASPDYIKTPSDTISTTRTAVRRSKRRSHGSTTIDEHVDCNGIVDSRVTLKRKRGRPRKVPSDGDVTSSGNCSLSNVGNCSPSHVILAPIGDEGYVKCEAVDGDNMQPCSMNTCTSLQSEWKPHEDKLHVVDELSKTNSKAFSDETCDICLNVFQSKSTLLKHRLRKHQVIIGHGDNAARQNSRYYPCKYCQQVFTNGSSRHRHQKFYCKSNPDCKRPSCCNQCGNFFSCKEELQAHRERKHTDSSRYICHLCGVELFSRSSIYFHKLKRHSGKPPKFQCTHCQKAFYTRSKLEKHITTHFDARDIQCELCGKRFKTQQHVHQHKKTVHENRYRFRCEKCGHGMEKLQYLKSHKCGRVKRSQEISAVLAPTQDVTSVADVMAEHPPLNQDHLRSATAPILYSAIDNELSTHYLTPDMSSYHNHQQGEPVLDQVAPTQMSYITQDLLPSYAPYVMPHTNIQY